MAANIRKASLMSNRIFPNYKIIGTLLLVLGVLVILFTIPLSAKENAKIELPDGLYMYDSWISHTKGESVRFEKFFVVQNNIIYSSREAIRKFGISKLNKLFTENKKYKILFGGKKIGEIQNLAVDDEDGHKVYKEKLLTKNIKESPAYWKESIYLGRLGSAVKCLAVPEEYKEVKKKVYNTIQQGEVDKIAKLAKEKLLPMIINRKELKQYKIKDAELYKEDLMLLDKMSYQSNDLYIGIYRYMFKIREYFIVFGTIKDNIYVITSNYSDEVPDYDGVVSIYGMLDVDGDGNEELIMEKVFSGLDEAIYNIEIYKQEADGKWARIQKISWEVKP